MNPYEVMFIIDSTAEAEEAVDGYIERFGSLIVQNGGQVTGVDKWGKRRFAYEINGRTEGYYVVLTFKATPRGRRRADPRDASHGSRRPASRRPSRRSCESRRKAACRSAPGRVRRRRAGAGSGRKRRASPS